jgi:outer membrane protein assembly factor BamD (BamD/ComL family)
MKLKFLFTSIVISFVIAACSNSKPAETPAAITPAAADSNKRLAKNYLTDCRQFYLEARRSDSILLQQTEIDVKAARKAIKDFTNFAYYCQSDSLSPVFLIKTAQVARAINDVPEAKLVLDRCIADYPFFRNRAAALFLLAQLYDEPGYLNNEQEAKKLYQKIIDEHPKSDWAVSAKGAINFIGKSDKQIMQELKKKK